MTDRVSLTLGVDLPALQRLGWSDDLQDNLQALYPNIADFSATEPSATEPITAEKNPDAFVARVIGVERTGLTIAPEGLLGIDQVPLSGRWFRGDEETRPTIGDWVVVDARTGTLLDLLPRRSLIKRVNPLGALQLIAANVDTALIVTSCNADFSPERLERYLSVVMEADIQPLLVLTKTDLIDDASVYGEVLTERFPDIPQVLLNALEASAVASLEPWCAPGQTLALLGSSGVGKSTLVNSLLGGEVQTTAAIREEDGKGRHTTTNRSLHRLPQGGVILDSPGMRELQLAEAEEGLDQLFADVEALAAMCRFNDCSHAGEPGCAIAAALQAGELDHERLTSYLSLKAEEIRNRESLAARRSRDRAFGKKVRGAVRAKRADLDADE
ncbi:MAG TPA: ribosome small subunit-dependent GTPase A [Gammaproteobacteria bacterium]|nr:ribosome small subunit-dependent GTPase A [Gammaproteobacteria bacterium]